jgi:outer membrane beta-barrel protein
MRRNLFLSLAPLTLTLLGASSAWADDALDEEQVATYAVQSRLFRLGGELNAAAGILPMNAFYKGLTVGGSFTYHFSNAWAWEIINGSYVYKQLETGLMNELRENYRVQPTDIAAIDLMLSSSFVFKPFYGKLAYLNRRLIHIELSVPLGLTLARYTNPQTYLPGPNAGLILRVYLSPHTSVRIDVRDHLILKNGWGSPTKWDTRNELHVSLGFAFAWGGDER